MKKMFIAFVIIILSIILLIFIDPWKTVHFMSINKNDNVLGIENFKKLKNTYPEYFFNDVFFYVVSKGKNESIYSTSDPYCLNIIFLDYIGEKKIEIKEISVLNTDLEIEEKIQINDDLILYTKYTNLKNSKTSELLKSDYCTAYFTIDNLYNIDKYKKNIEIYLDFVIDNDEKQIVLELKRYTTYGLLKWRY